MTKLKVTLKKSVIGSTESQYATRRIELGLKIRNSRVDQYTCSSRNDQESYSRVDVEE